MPTKLSASVVVNEKIKKDTKHKTQNYEILESSTIKCVFLGPSHSANSQFGLYRGILGKLNRSSLLGDIRHSTAKMSCLLVDSKYKGM